ncbi:TerD family protein [Cytobacillus gottheilii]|uniref:TerD family protein n=1 Tax=Cytobacillus gottheilii TaxID=859144 RepID=UPI0009BA8DFD|nr:TerD family protein [Cytobacillus gottheilii]
MGVRLRKGQKVDLTKSNPGLQVVVAGLGWDVSGGSANYDLDASAFLTNAAGKVQSDLDFVFYNNPTGGNGSVIYTGDNRTGAGHQDDEQIKIDLNQVPASIEKISFAITIHDAQMKGQNFGQIQNAYVRIFNAFTNEELLRFDLGREFTVETAIVAAELYRHNGEWKFNATGAGFQGGLAALCRNFGIDVDDEPAPAQPQVGNFQPSFQAPPAQPSYQQPSYQQNTYNQQPSYQSQSQPSFGQANYNSNPYNQQPSHSQQGYGSATQPTQHLQPSSNYGDNVSCTRCGSTNVRTGEKGFGLGKAAIGGLILGPIGLLGGFIGKNQLKFSCNQCGNNWSPNQTDYAQWANDQKNKAQALFARYKSQDVLDAVVASCALVGMADGRLDPSERQKMMEFIHQSQELKVFETNKVVQQFNMFVQKIEMDPIIGRAEAFKAVGRVRSKPEIARLVARYCIAIGYADGHFDPNEKQAVTEICMELGLNPHEFLS